MRKRIVGGTTLAVLAGFITYGGGVASAASAVTHLVSTPKSQAGWSVDNRPGGAGTRTNPVYTGKPQDGNGSLRFSTPSTDDAQATYHAAAGTLGTVTALNYDWQKAPTGDKTFAPAYILWLDQDGSAATTADRTALVYEPTLQSDPATGTGCNATGTLPTDKWVTADVDAGCLWTSEDGTQVAVPFSTLKTRYSAWTALAYGLSQGDGNPNTLAFADTVRFANAAIDQTTNFEATPPPPPTYTVNGGSVTVGVSYDGSTFQLLRAGQTTDSLGHTQSARYILNGGGYCIHMAWNDSGTTWTPYVNRYSATRVVVGPFSGAHNWRVIATRGVCHTNTTIAALTATTPDCVSCHGGMFTAPAGEATAALVSTYTFNGGNAGVGVSWDEVHFPLLPVGKTTYDMGSNQAARYWYNGGGYCLHAAWNDGELGWTPYWNHYSAGRVIEGPFSGAHNWRTIATPGVCHSNTT